MIETALLLTAAATLIAIAPGAPIERYYCTQFGPFSMRFDSDKAAGYFAILANDDLGAVVGTIEGQSFSGRWFEIDSRGDISIEFSQDWASFDAAYIVDGSPDLWHRGWVGQLRPEYLPASFEKGGVRFLCSS